MNPQSVTVISNEEISTSRLWWVIPLAMALATLANVIFYFIVTRILGEPLLFPEQFPPPETSPMPVTDVMIFSLIFSLGAGMVFALVAGLSQRPVRTFLIISTVVLVLSCALPLKAPTPPVTLPAKLTLVSMHIIGAVAVVGSLIRLSKRNEREQFLKLFSKIHVFLYRLSRGSVWNSMNGLPVMLLTTTGRKTGHPHIVPVVFLKDGSNYVIAPGVVERPAWYLNLRANPQAKIQIGRFSAQVEAAIAGGEERRRLWAMVPPYWEAYQKNARGELPVVILKIPVKGDDITGEPKSRTLAAGEIWD